MKIGLEGGRGQALGVGKPLDLGARREGSPASPWMGKGGRKKTRQRDIATGPPCLPSVGTAGFEPATP